MNVPIQRAITSKSTWVFGYGSLIHTPNFQYNQRVVGYIKGYRRVFWQVCKPPDPARAVIHMYIMLCSHLRIGQVPIERLSVS